jgi:hypothetical protein
MCICCSQHSNSIHNRSLLSHGWEWKIKARWDEEERKRWIRKILIIKKVVVIKREVRENNEINYSKE